jgi:peptidase M1-like protein
MRRVAVAVCLLAVSACSGGQGEAARPAASVPSTSGTSGTSTTVATATTTTAVTSQGSTTTRRPTTRAAAPSPPPAGVPCEVPAGYPEPWAERPRYTAHLAVDPGGRKVTGDLGVRFVPEAATDRLVFRLWANAPRLGRAGSRFEVTGATVGGRPTPGTYEAAGAAAGRPGTVFSLSGSFPAGQAVEARLEFRLAMPGAVRDRIAQVGGTMRLGSVLPVLSWIRGRGWHTTPAVSLSAEAAASEVADWDVTVAVPAGYTTLATGEEPEPGHFVARAVRDWGATVGRLRLGQASALGGRTAVVAGVAEGAAGDPAAIARRAAQAVDGLSARFGDYPYPRLTVGVTPGLSGGIEFPTHIHLGSGASTIHLVHEVAHQWFYATVGNDQYRDPWLDEGLATYAEARVDGRLAGQRARAVPADGKRRLGESMAYWSARPSVYFLSVYVGGLQALATLADRLGGYDRLDCGLRRYHRDRAFTVARPADLMDAIAAQTGFDPRLILVTFGVPTS